MEIAFTLDFDLTEKGLDTVAYLSSNNLHPQLHPTGKMRICFESDSENEPGSVHVESFQLRSLSRYLSQQQEIVRIAEEELTNARADWMRRWGGPPNKSIWDDSQYKELWLPTMSHNLFVKGTMDTDSMYIAIFGVQWDQEHVRRTLKFRDDKFVSLGIDGE